MALYRENVVDLFNPENELDRIAYSHSPRKVERALRFLIKESDTFLELKHMIDLYDSKEDFNTHLTDMVKKGTTIRKKVLKCLPKQFKVWQFSKRYYAKKLIKIINRKQ